MKILLSNKSRQPISVGPVSRIVLERIKDAIINKVYKPGDYLPSEQELVQTLGVGKSSIREAIKMLEAIGVVEVRRGKYTYIRQHPDVDSINTLIFQLILEQGSSQDIFDLRTMFEPAYSLMAMRMATEEDIKEVSETITNFESKIKIKELTAQDDLLFHYAILRSTHNPFVIRIGDTVLQLFKASIEKSIVRVPDIALKDHKNIFKAFCEKDQGKLVKAILDSFQGWIMNSD